MANELTGNLATDSQIGHYRIAGKIGAGGMGEVYLAEDTRLDRRVAVKFLNEELSRDADKLRRFVQEAKAASALNHPNILTVYEIGEAGEKNYIATEFIEGETLRERLCGKESPQPNFVLSVGIQIAEALAAAHRAGIVHRDIKPENVMVRADGYVKVLDFGLAKLTEPKAAGAEDETLVHSNPGMILGTVAYMSPEQSRGLKVDARSDIWSFGVVLYEMLAGKAPFAGETATDVMLAIVQKEPPALRHAAPDLPDELYFIVGKMLRKKLDERYQSIADALNDLRRLKQRLDYEEIERTLSPEDSKARAASQEQQTAIFNQQQKQVSDSGEAVSSISSTSASEKLPPNNLSAELSPLIGREAEIAEIEKLLKQPDVRLLTLTGVGGTGKTRLAQAIAHNALAEFTDGVYFIDLSAVESTDLVVPIIAQTLGVREASGKPLKEQLRDELREKKLLIVLDNFEQITKAAAQIGELLSGAARLKCLVTSRVRLQLRFEREFVLQPLAVPVDKGLTAAELGEYPAVRLFVERARAAKSGFELTEDNAASVAEICRHLDGLPLAIELAAARVKLLAPQAILTRLVNSLKLLAGGARDLPERQQTMRAAIKWSYDLLETEERKLLNRLAVFGGGFTLDAAEQVAGSETDLEIDLFDGAASLADKSLLAQRETADGEPRFRMLVVVRQFALEELEAAGGDEASEIKRRHAEFFARLAEEACAELKGAKAGEWYERLEEEHDNLRLALEWSLDGRGEPETALRIVAGVWRFWNRRGYLAEGGKWIKQTLDKTGEAADAKLRAVAYSGIGFLSLYQGDLQAAESFGEESLRIARQLGDQESIARALNLLGSAKQYMGEPDAAQALYEEGLAAARAAGDKPRIASLVGNLAGAAQAREDYAAARKYTEEAYTIAKAESMKPSLAAQASNLAEILCLLEDYAAAHAYALEALDLSEQLGDGIRIAAALDKLGAIAASNGEMEKAVRLWGAAEALFESKGYKIEITEQEFLARYESSARAAIGDQAYEAARREGKQMRLKNALALARETN